MNIGNCVCVCILWLFFIVVYHILAKRHRRRYTPNHLLRMREPVSNFLPPTQHAETVERPQRRLWIFLGFVALLLVGTMIARAVIRQELPNDPAIYDPITLEPKEQGGILKRLGQFVFQSTVSLPVGEEEGITFLVLGMGGEGHDGPYLTDTIILARLFPKTGEIALVSIPRDLAVSVPGNGTKKINHLNALGEQKKSGWGAAATTEQMEELFDLSIDYYIRLDFSAFETIIDEIGGVEIKVARPFTDSLFPAQNNQYQTISFAQGEQTMNGKRALQFARSRHGTNGEGSDFARARRQQQLLLAVKEKVLSFQTLANPIKIHAIIQTLDTHLSTNMEFGEMIALIKLARSMPNREIRLLTLDTGPDGLLVADTTPEGAFILRPKTGIEWKEINETIQNNLEQKKDQTTIVPNATKSEEPKEESGSQSELPTVEIQNGTWRAGLAAQRKQELESAGIAVAIIGNAAVRPQETNGLYLLKNTPEHATVAAAIAKILDIAVETAPLPPGIAASPNTDILLLLGEPL